jgi:hypothetical protein
MPEDAALTTKEIIENAILSSAACRLAKDKDEMPPAEYMKLLEEQGMYQDAIRFLGHKLEPKKAVEWAVKAVRELQGPDQVEANRASLEASETWIKAPSDGARYAAKEAADKSGVTTPADCAALAVYLAGDSISLPDSPKVSPPPYAAQRMASGAVEIAVVTHEPQHAEQRYKRALELGREMDG